MNGVKDERRVCFAFAVAKKKKRAPYTDGPVFRKRFVRVTAAMQRTVRRGARVSRANIGGGGSHDVEPLEGRTDEPRGSRGDVPSRSFIQFLYSFYFFIFDRRQVELVKNLCTGKNSYCHSET